MSLSMVDRRSEWDKLVKFSKIDKKSHTKVGFQRKDGIKEKESDVLVVDVAIENEFGTYRTPARSFIRTYWEDKKDYLAKTSATLYYDVLLGRRDAKKSLTTLGEMAKAGIQQKIDSIYDPPLSPRTIERKKSTKPLIDTGQMRASITHEEIMGES